MQNIFKKTKTTSITPSYLISKRDSLITDIKREWNRINSFNVIQNGQVQAFDLKAVYKQITQFESELIKVKVAIQCVNMGLKSLKELPTDSVYPTIFLLSQLKERKVKLLKIPTKKEDGESVVFTRTFVEEEVSKINKHIEAIEKEIELYNNDVSFKLD
jgi:hypothetical protein